MANPILYGPGYSTYVRTARLALIEKGVNHELQEFDFMQGMPEAQLKRQPFGKVPAFEHDGFALYETVAITRYVDEAFPGPALQPAAVRERARMTQIISIIDSYLYGPTISTVVIQRLVMPMLGNAPDEAAIQAALPNVERALLALENLLGQQTYLAGASLSLADLYLAPIFAYLTQTPESGLLLPKTPNLQCWWNAISGRTSMANTQPKLG